MPLSRLWITSRGDPILGYSAKAATNDRTILGSKVQKSTPLALLALGGLLLGACSPTEPTDTPTATASASSQPPSVSPSASPTPSESVTLPEPSKDTSEEGIRNTVLNFNEVFQYYMMNPEVEDLTPLTNFTTGNGTGLVLNILDSYREIDGIEGTQKVTILQIGDQVESDGTTTVQVTSCVDSRGITFVDDDGEVKPPAIPLQTQLFELTQVNGYWLVSSTITGEPSC